MNNRDIVDYIMNRHFSGIADYDDYIHEDYQNNMIFSNNLGQQMNKAEYMDLMRWDVKRFDPEKIKFIDLKLVADGDDVAIFAAFDGEVDGKDGLRKFANLYTFKDSKVISMSFMGNNFEWLRETNLEYLRSLIVGEEDKKRLEDYIQKLRNEGIIN